MGKSVYAESPIKLIRKVLTSRSLGQQCFTSNQIRAWVLAEYPKTTEERFSTNIKILTTNDPARRNWPEHLNGENDFLYRKQDGTFRLFRPGKDPRPRKKEAMPDKHSSRFPRQSSDNERKLRDALSLSLEALEPGLRHFDVNNSVEYPITGGAIDILAVDAKGALVVIELKVGLANSRAVGQVAHYLGWVRKHLPCPRGVRGILVSRETNKSLEYAIGEIRPRVQWMPFPQDVWSKALR